MRADKSKKANIEPPSIETPQKDIIVEIIRMLDKHLKECFPKQTQNDLYEQFSDLLVIPSRNYEKVEGAKGRIMLGAPEAEDRESKTFKDIKNVKMFGSMKMKSGSPEHARVAELGEEIG